MARGGLSGGKKRVERDDGATVVVGGEAVPRWRARRDGGGAAALARRAAAAGVDSLLRELEPFVDLVATVGPRLQGLALHEAARRGGRTRGSF